MSVRFRRTKQIAPGIRLNLNKDSAGLSFGPRGMKYTVNSKGGKRATVGLPGTGLYMTESISAGTTKVSDTEVKGMESNIIIKSAELKPAFTVEGRREPVINKLAIKIAGYLFGALTALVINFIIGALFVFCIWMLARKLPVREIIPPINDYDLSKDINADWAEIISYLKIIEFINTLDSPNADFSLSELNKYYITGERFTKYGIDKLVDGGLLNKNAGRYSLDKDTFNYFSGKRAEYFSNLADKYTKIAHTLSNDEAYHYKNDDVQKVFDYATFCSDRAMEENTID